MLRQEILVRFNQERTAAGAAPLQIIDPLNQVAQENAEEVREKGGVVYDERSIPTIQRRLRKSGYEAHGWHQAFAAGPDDPPAVFEWVKEQYPETFHSLMDPDYQEVGIGISEIQGTPLAEQKTPADSRRSSLAPSPGGIESDAGVFS